MNIGKSVRISLADINQTKRWLANRMEVSPGYVSDICNEKEVPSLDRVVELAGIFEVRVSEFIARGEG